MIKEKSFSEITIGEIVTADFRAAEIFKNAGIDFCCGGKKSLDAACKEKALNPDSIVEALEKLSVTEDRTFNFNEWNLSFLSDYIENTHHTYVKKTLPELIFYTKKIAHVHGSNHPELNEVADLFASINAELTQHLKNEEEVLFPAIKKALENNSSEARQTIKSEITRMSGEHDFAGGAMDDISVVTRGYYIPTDACNTYRVCFQLLKQFEDDLHIHVHLENNILFPKALNL